MKVVAGTANQMALDLLGASGLARAFGSMSHSRGVIFMLHHVRAASSDGFEPNAGIEVTPEFVDATISLVRQRGFALVSLPEAVEALVDPGRRRGRFAVFTIDDGYEDTFDSALPVFRSRGCPFTVFLCSQIVEGSLLQWWRALEHLIGTSSRLEIPTGAGRDVLITASDNDKNSAWRRLYPVLYSMDPTRQNEWVGETCRINGVDPGRLPRRPGMGWEAARRLATEPLCTLGAHTLAHPALARLDKDAALDEIVASRERISAMTGETPEYFAYPYGDSGSASSREYDMVHQSGFVAAVTTRRGIIFDRHRHHLESLPRIFLTGNHQRTTYVDALISGLPFEVARRLQPGSVD